MDNFTSITLHSNQELLHFWPVLKAQLVAMFVDKYTRRFTTGHEIHSKV